MVLAAGVVRVWFCVDCGGIVGGFVVIVGGSWGIVGPAGLYGRANEGPECQNRKSTAVDGELKDGREELTGGREELKDGLEEFMDSLREFMGGLELLTDGLELRRGGAEKQRKNPGGPTDGSSWPFKAMAMPHPVTDTR